MGVSRPFFMAEVICLSLALFFLVVILLYVLYLWHEDNKSNAAQREALYDRIMSPSIKEYKDNTTPEPNTITPTNEEIVELEDARDEVLGEDNA